MASKVKLRHIYKGLIIWLGLHCTFCELDRTSSDKIGRQWPYPIVSGNFEDLTGVLEQYVKNKEEIFNSNTMMSDSSDSEVIPKQIAASLTGNQTVKLAAVYDDVLLERHIDTLQMYATIARDWRFSQSESMPWSAWLDSSVINLSEVNRAFEPLVEDLKQTGSKYYPYETTVHILRRGDAVSLIQGDPDDIILLYYLKDGWEINFYGELILYEGEEIAMSIKPAFNRAIVWNGSLAYYPKSPSINCKDSLYFLMIKYTSNKTKVDEFEARRLQAIEEKKSAEDNLFQSLMEVNGHYGNLNAAEHKIKDHTGTNGKKIYVFDDLFMSDDLFKLRNYVEHYGDYYFDDSYSEDSDNVQWISAINYESFVESRVWHVIQKVAKFASGISTWYPYDISCNNIRAFDSTQNHQDCETWENEWTFLIYLNQNWTVNYGGETAFYSDSEHYEYVTSVRPKYGRAVIFEGIIPHSARPPSSVHLGPRFTFAVKVSINPWTALRKNIKQEIAHEEYLHYAGLSPLYKYYNDQLELLEREDTTLHRLVQEMLPQKKEEEKQVCDPGGHCTESLHPTRYTGDDQIRELIADITEEDEDYVEDSYIDLSDFPEVLSRKLHIYKSIAEAGTDCEKLREIRTQFFLDLSEMKRRYLKLLEIVL